MEDWKHIIPFLGLFAAQSPPNRPAFTRLLEQVLVAIIAGAGGAYIGITVTQARIDQEVADMRMTEAEHYSQVTNQMQEQSAMIQSQLATIQEALYGSRRK